MLIRDRITCAHMYITSINISGQETEALRLDTESVGSATPRHVKLRTTTWIEALAGSPFKDMQHKAKSHAQCVTSVAAVAT